MQDVDKTREQLLVELALLRQRLAVHEEQAPAEDIDFLEEKRNSAHAADGLFEAPIWVENLKERRGRKALKQGRLQIRVPDRFLRTIFDSVPAGISIATDTSCRVIRHNPAGAEFLRIKPWDNVSFSAPVKPVFKIQCRGKEMLTEEMPMQRAAWYGDEIKDLEMDFVWEDGVRKTARWSASPLFGDDGETIGAIGVFEDITKRKQAEMALRESEEKYRVLAERLRDTDLPQSEDRFRRIFHNSPVMMSITRLENGEFVDVNQVWMRSLGYSRQETIGRTSFDLNIWADPRQREEVYRRLRTAGSLPAVEADFKTREGKTINVVCSAEVVTLGGQNCVLANMVDITENKRLGRELARLDRLNLVGEMAASIGHEIRNPMTTVRGFLQMLSQREKYAEDQEFFRLMIDEIDRANDIISSFLSLAGNKAIDLRPAKIDSIISSLYPLVKADALVADKNVVMVLDEVPPLMLDEKEIRQMVLNLARNGLEAMQPGGTLTIGTRVDEKRPVLFIKDEGSGVDPELLDKIGTPFQTTKENGTGLGLPVCYSIAHRHMADIEVETGPGGTTFYVKFKARP